MVKIRYKFGRGKVFLNVILFKDTIYYWFPKKSSHKKFHPRQIFTRNIKFSSYQDNLIYYYEDYYDDRGWILGELKDEIVRKKLGIQIITEDDYCYGQLFKAC